MGKKKINGITIKKSGEVVGVIESVEISKTNMMKKVFEINYEPRTFVPAKYKGGYGKSPLLAIVKDLMYLRIREKAQAELYCACGNVSEEERRIIMEKYAVKVDKNKVAKKKEGEKTASTDDPNTNTNVPIDPELGSEPFETEPEDG